MMRKLLFTMATVVLCFAISSISYAQDESAVERHKASMGKAAAEFNKGNLTKSLQLYLEERTRLEDISPLTVEYSIARNYQRLHQCKEAQALYTRIITNPDVDTESDVYQRAVQGFDDIEECESWGQVTVNCTVDFDHTLYIDNESVGQCWDRPYSLTAGKHRFTLKTADGREAKGVVTVGNGEKSDIRLIVAPVEKVVEKLVTEESASKESKKISFSPHLYWGLIAGGALLAGGSGWFAYLAQKSIPDKDAISLNNALTGTFAGVGGALMIAGAALAVVNYVVNKPKDDAVENVQAFAAPIQDGGYLGVSLNF